MILPPMITVNHNYTWDLKKKKKSRRVAHAELLIRAVNRITKQSNKPFISTIIILELCSANTRFAQVYFRFLQQIFDLLF